jgi:cyclic pyranopterin phosphate synthase
MAELPILDTFGRRHTNLRISVTDRCNIRCVYCMPSEHVVFRPRGDLLTFEEIARFVRIVAEMGVNKIRLTGGEPLVRTGLERLVAQLAGIPGIADLALTTNGILLADQAERLAAAGLQRLNVSLDCLDDETFEKISRRRGIDRVIAGILAAKQLNFARIRLNSVILPGVNSHAILDLARFARTHRLELRFIEFMPLNAEGPWASGQVITGAMMRQQIEREFGALSPVPPDDPSQPARDYEYSDGIRIGFVDSVSEPFCSSCNRMRLTAEGQIRNCLFSDDEWDVRRLLRDPHQDDLAIQQLVRQCVSAKWAGHGIHSQSFVKPRTAMYQIGG